MRFKTMMLVLALMVLSVMSAQAQSFDLGLESGMNFSYLVGSDAQGLNLSGVSSSRLGFVGGGFVSLNFGPAFAVRPELLYEQKGSQVSGTTTTYEVDYIELPVLLKFSLGPALPSLLVGPSFNWSTVSSLPSGSGTLNSGDVGLVGGLQLDFSKFFINGRYELGLDNVSTGKNLQNGTFTVLMGYSFI
jgi:hypothetical protein